MVERVEPFEPLPDGTLRWDPNAPEAFLASDDFGRSALALRAHPDDPDQRCVVLRWDSVRYALMGPPNDEALHQHRLYEAGIDSVLWVGVVRDSALLAALRPTWSAASSSVPVHYVILSKECVVEVIAASLAVFRVDGRPGDAATSSVARTPDRAARS